MNRPKVFISHIKEEKVLADLLKEHIVDDFLGLIEVFVSSDTESIPVGEKWLNDVDKALKEAKLEIILCSEDSVKRPWINFEAGAGWVKGIPVVPVCHTGMVPGNLPIPLSMLQAIEGNNEQGLERLYARLAKGLSAETPKGDFTAIRMKVEEFEHEYGVVRLVAGSVSKLIALVPQLEQIFRPVPEHKSAKGNVNDIVLDKMRPHLDRLQTRGMIAYSTGSNFMELSTTEGGNKIELEIRVKDPYYEIANKVLSLGA